MKVIHKVTITWLLCNIFVKLYANLQWFSVIPDYIPMQSFWLFADISVIAANLFAAYVLIQEKLHATLTIFLFIGVALNICGSLLIPARQNLPEELYWLFTNLLVAATSMAVTLLLGSVHTNLIAPVAPKNPPIEARREKFGHSK